MPSVYRLQGVTDDSTDTSSNAPSILAINGFFCGFTILVVMARMYVRAVMLKTCGIDDYLIFAAMICGIGVLVVFIGETHHGIGMHTAAIPRSDLIKMLHWQYFHSIIVTVGISLIKLSVAFFLLRLVPGKGYKRFLYGTIAFLIAFTFASAGTIAFSCVPVRASWDAASEPNAKCFSNDTFTAIGLFNSSINIVTDILFASLPITVVWNLQVNKRTKVSLLAILSLGYFACVASIIKTVIQTKVLSNPDSTRNDSYFIWNSIELYVGILAASLPSLRPLFRTILETTQSRLRTRRTGATGSSNNLGPRHKYYMHEDAIGMNSLPGQSKGEGYGVKVTTRSEEEFDFGISGGKNIDGDASSSEDILPIQGRTLQKGGITKTVSINVS